MFQTRMMHTIFQEDVGLPVWLCILRVHTYTQKYNMHMYLYIQIHLHLFV